MDPLAHGLAGSALAVATLAPVARKHPRRVIGVGAALGNLPDIDYVTLAISDEVWLYHHRGLTHSLLGLLFLVPAGMWITRKIIGPDDAEQMGKQRIALCSLLCIALGHNLLDYLTSFGLMWLYPFSFERIAAGLMFIVDPIFWVICVVGALVIAKRKFSSDRGIQMAAFVTLGAMVALWTVEAVMRHNAVTIAKAGWQERGISIDSIHAYPMVTAPMVWTVVTEHEDTYPQSVISMWPTVLRGEEPATFFPDFPDDHTAGKICDDQEYGPEATARFERYNAFIHPVVCAAQKREGKDGCRCYGLKYSVVSDKRARFAGYWISPQGETHLVAPESHPDDARLFKSLF